MSLSRALLVFKKDWLEIKRNRQITVPIIVVPLIISAFLPAVLILLPTFLPAQQGFQGFEAVIRNLPPDVRNEIAGMTSEQAMAYLFALYFFAPIFLIIPLMASSVIASDSFAGEKERKTIEALLATPLTDGELLLGKVLVAFIPSMIVTFAAFATYSTIVDVAGFGLFGGRILLPNLLWIALILGVTPTVAIAGIGVTVLISARVKGFREAQQISVVLMLPILMLVFAQVGGLAVFGPAMIALLTVLFGVIDLVVLRAGIKLFRRNQILSGKV